MKRHTTSISKQIIICFYLCFALLLAFWIFSTRSAMQKTLKEQKKADLSQILKTSSQYLELYEKEINANVVNLSNIFSLIDDEKQLRSILYSFKNEHSEQILNAILVGEQTIMFSDRTHLMEIIDDTVYRNFHESLKGSPYKGIRRSEPYASPLSLERTIALYKPLQNNKGTIICELNITEMVKSILELPQDYFFLISSLQKNIIAHSYFDYQEQEKLKGFDTFLQSDAFGSSDEATINDTTYTIKYYGNSVYNWDLAIFVPEVLINKAIRPLITTVSIIGISTMFIMIMVLMVIELYFSKPIAALANKIQKAGNLSEVNLDAEAHRSDEIGILARVLMEMQQKLEDLMAMQEQTSEKKRKLEIRMLQAQIHPHFLGNTLACIASLIKEHDYEQSHQSIILLIKLLNFSVANTDALISLKEELEATESYLKLRLMRSPGLFSYTVSIPSKHMHHRVPKLIIQPIVENAIIHGFTTVSRNNTLAIVSYEHEGKLMLSINNSGTFIQKEKIAQIMNGEIKPSPYSHGIGVMNVFKRLEYSEENSTGGTLYGDEKTGTTIILDLGMLVNG